VAGTSAIGREAFDVADGDGDGAVSLEELKVALDEPARVAFAAADVDGNGRLTKQEAQRIIGGIERRTDVRPVEPRGR
jgi:Ca2+-binding EF-hand superfamily protein